ncbi:hypothetical protein ScalyP_jg2520 [Parmales sp. scaly parma]|nr:hypothetical protein ScalyP_jg2520 [Parmales sp. scaly parma]
MILIIFLLFTTLIPTNSNKFIIGGYLPEYRFYIDLPSTVAKLNTITLFSLAPNSDGSIKSFISEMDLKRFDQNDQTDAKIAIAVGGGGRSAAFPAISNDGALRRRFVASLSEFMAVHPYITGIDFDWESPSSVQEASSYIRLIAEVRAKLGNSVTLSVALHPDQFLPSYDALDFVHLMTYDMRNPAGHAQFNDVVAAVNNFVVSGCPREKILLGIPLYGRDNVGGVATYSEIVDMAIDDNEELNVSERLPTNWRTTDMTASGIVYDGIQSAQRKAQWAIENKLAGIFFWELGQDKNEEHVSIVSAVRDVVEKGDRLTKSQMASKINEPRESLVKTATHEDVGSRRSRRKKKKQEKAAAKKRIRNKIKEVEL